MKLIIAGGRNYVFTEDDIAFLNSLPSVGEVVSGGASGADKHGEAWAKANGIPVKSFPALWQEYGKFAGPKRNNEMARYADAVVLFPGGAGTKSMARFATREGLMIYDRRTKAGES